MSANADHLISETEFRLVHALTDGPRREFVGGRMIPRDPSTLRHCRLAKAVDRALERLIGDRALEVHRPNLGIRVPNGNHRYPDVMLTTSPPVMLDDEQDVILNPIVLVEILSPSTEAEDRGRKLNEYRAIPSVTDYLILA